LLNSGGTPLHTALQEDQHDSALGLLQFVADIEAKTSSGKTALHLPAQYVPSLVAELIELGASFPTSRVMVEQRSIGDA